MRQLGREQPGRGCGRSQIGDHPTSAPVCISFEATHLNVVNPVTDAPTPPTPPTLFVLRMTSRDKYEPVESQRQTTHTRIHWFSRVAASDHQHLTVGKNGGGMIMP